jgi:excisionase family DNA binding protein
MWAQETAMSNAVSRAAEDFRTLATLLDLCIQRVEAGDRDAAPTLCDLRAVVGRMEPDGIALTARWEALREVINGMGIAEATTLSGLHRQTIYTLIRNRSIAAEKLPSGQIVIDRESLEAYIRRQRGRNRETLACQRDDPADRL